MKHERNAATRDVLDDWTIGFAKFWRVLITVNELRKAGFNRKYPGDGEYTVVPEPGFHGLAFRVPKVNNAQVVLGVCAARY